MMLRYVVFFIAVVYISLERSQGLLIEGPATAVVLPPVDVVQFNCTHTEGASQWRVNGRLLLPSDLNNGTLPGHNISVLNVPNGSGTAILVTNIVLGDDRNGSEYVCVIPQAFPEPAISSDPAFLIVAGVPEMVPGLIVVPDSVSIDGGIISLTIYWGEPFNSFDPIIRYTIQCDSDSSCVGPFTTSDNTTRSHNFTSLVPTANYTFSVFATNSLGDGMAANVTVNGLLAFGVPNEITGLNLTCQPIGTMNNCTSYWNPPTQGSDDLAMLQYTVYVNGAFLMNVTETTISFPAPSLPEGEFMGNVTIRLRPVNRFGEGPESDNVTAVIMSSSVTNITVTVTTADTPSDTHSATVICKIHINSTADNCQVMAVPVIDRYIPITMSGPISNSMASVMINNLTCEAMYGISAAGTLGGELVGPSLSYGTLTSGPCPVEVTTTSVMPTMSSTTMTGTPTPTVAGNDGSAAGLKCSMGLMVAVLIAMMIM